MIFSKIEGPGSIRTGLDTGPTSDASIVVDGHNTILSLVGCIYGTNRNAGRVVALQAGSGKKFSCNLGIGSHFLFENGTIHHSRRQMIFSHTSHRTCMTPHTFFQIDYHNPVPLLLLILHGLLNLFLHSQEFVFFEFGKVGKGWGRFM
jgi:hypothetical protein